MNNAESTDPVPSSDSEMRQRAEAILAKLRERRFNEMPTTPIRVEPTVTPPVLKPDPAYFLKTREQRFNYDSLPSNVLDRVLTVVYEDFEQTRATGAPFDPFNKKAQYIANQLGFLSARDSQEAAEFLFEYYYFLKKQMSSATRAAHKIIGLSGEHSSEG